MQSSILPNIDLTSISKLQKKLEDILIYKQFCVYRDPYSLLHVKCGYNKYLLSPNSLRLILIIKFPALIEIESYLTQDYYENIHDISIAFIPKNRNDFRELLSNEEISNLIKLHNSKVIKPKLGEKLSEKNVYLDWRGYNTPTFKDCKITPLTGTYFSKINYDYTALAIYNQWLSSSCMLILEYDILQKAKLYLELTEENRKYNLNFRHAYIYWLNRQYNMVNMESLLKSDVFILDFFKDKKIFYREVCEDLLYVSLNILLAKEIINNKYLPIYLEQDKYFFDLLELIIKKHYDENELGYKCLKELRMYSANYALSVYQLDTIYSEFNN